MDQKRVRRVIFCARGRSPGRSYLAGEQLKGDEDLPFEATTAGEDLYTRIYALSPANDVQRSLKERAILSTDLAQVRLLLFEQTSNSIPSPFLAMLVSSARDHFCQF